MKRFVALMLALCLLAAMIPRGAAAQAGETAVLDRVDPGMQICVTALRQEAVRVLENQNNGENIIMPTFEMYGMTVLEGKNMVIRFNLHRENSENVAGILIYKGHYESLDENAELVASGEVSQSSGGGLSMTWETDDCEPGDYTVYFVVLSPEGELLTASIADVYISDREIPLEKLGIYVMELGMETDTVYIPAGSYDLMTLQPVRYPYHTTDRSNVIINSANHDMLTGSGNFYGEDGRSVTPTVGTHQLQAYISKNGEKKFLTHLNIVVEEPGAQHTMIHPENGYLNICSGVAFPVQVDVPEGYTLEDALIQTSRPGLLEAWIENDTLYVRALVESSRMSQLVIAFGQTFDVKGFYIGDHSYRPEWVRPTCTEDGTKSQVCEHCGHVQSVEILPATGHNMKLKTVLTARTATKDGLAMGECRTCGHEEEMILPRIFTDTQPDWFYSDALDYCYEKGIINGLTANTFGPGETLNRAQLVTMLYRHAGSPEVEGENLFTDVPDGQFYTNAVIWASVSGIVNGYEDSSFRPGNPINRQELVTMLHRYAVSLGKDNGQRSDLSAFTDLDQLMGYAADAMQWAVANGVINGISETQLGPQQSANRAQTVTILYRIITGTLGE